MTSNAKDRTLKLVAAAYGAAIRPERFDDLLQAWDDWFDHLVEESDTAFSEVSPVFDDALIQADHLHSALPGAWRDQSPVPTVLADVDGRFVTLNASARNLFDEEGLDAADVLARRTAITDQIGTGRHRTYRLAGGALHRSYLAVEAQVNSAMKADHPDAHTAFHLSLMDWHAAFERHVGEQLDLSAAELRVARGLFEGRTAQEISGDLGRSLPTIRSHIKALLQKTGARRQTELVQFLTILRQVSDVVSSSPASGSSANFEQTRLTGPAGQLEVVRYGAGQSVLYFTTSSCPEETPEFRNALIKAGFCVVAPVRPGFRDSDPVRGDASDALIEDWLDPLLALTGPKPLLVGHREGGIVAAQAAERILAKGGAISGLVLLSTGAPMPDLSKFEDRPPSIRRSFLGAHVAAPALRLGYKTAARLFHTSTVGKDQIIRFFHKDSPADRVKLDEPRFYEITRDNLNLCFDNTDQIVRDVALWGSDWSEVLNSVIAGARVTFVHGAEHVFHRLDDLLTVVSDMDRASLTVIPGAGQLGIYEGRTSWRRRW